MIVEYYNIDFSINYQSEEIDSNRIYNIIKNYINNYIMIYKNNPHIYVGKDCFDFILYSDKFHLISYKSSKPYIGILYDCYLYINTDLQEGDFYLSNNKIDFKQYNRKLKIEKINNYYNENSKI